MNHDSLTIRVRHEPGYVLLAAAALRLARTLAEALQALPAAPRARRPAATARLCPFGGDDDDDD